MGKSEPKWIATDCTICYHSCGMNVRVEDGRITKVEGLKDHPDLAFDYLRNVAGLDMVEDGLWVKYHFYSFKHGHALQVTVATPPGNPHVSTLTGLYAGADWHDHLAA